MLSVGVGGDGGVLDEVEFFGKIFLVVLPVSGWLAASECLTNFCEFFMGLPFSWMGRWILLAIEFVALWSFGRLFAYFQLRSTWLIVFNIDYDCCNCAAMKN